MVGASRLDALGHLFDTAIHFISGDMFFLAGRAGGFSDGRTVVVRAGGGQ